MVEKAGQKLLVEVDQLQGRRRLAKALLCETEQQRERVAVTRHSARAQCTLLHYVVGEELLNQ